MAQLGSFRKGWENENLARFILSRFSFVSQPSSISDDIGSDFFCTLFKRQKNDGYTYLIPKNSFAIQIKSNDDQIDATNKIQYLESLEIPFFVGVVTQSDQKITFYTSEVIPSFFSFVGFPETLQIKLVKTREINETSPRLKNYTISFPKTLEIKANIKQEDLDKLVNKLYELCIRMQENIASKISKEYIFQDFSNKVINVIAGKGSYGNFRLNFLKRLAEVFCNLKWIYPQLKDETDIDNFMKEYRIYKSLYLSLENFRELPNWLKDYFKDLEKIVEK